MKHFLLRIRFSIDFWFCSKYDKQFLFPNRGGNHPQGESAFWHNIDLYLWAISHLLLKLKTFASLSIFMFNSLEQKNF